MEGQPAARWPTVTLVFLSFNRRDELRTSLRKMLHEIDYDESLIDVVVVDNASEDGSQAMVEQEFPEVRLIKRPVNSGVSAWNDGFAVARGEYVLALDDDAYLPGDSLRRGVEGALAAGAELVSFGVVASDDPEYRFDSDYRTGLLSFWGCAVLIRRTVLEELGGYDPEIFVWANELELTMRFFDRGYRHLHMPQTLAVHMKPPPGDWTGFYGSHPYRVNAKNFAYIAGKLLRPRDALVALVALLSTNVRDALRISPDSIRGALSTLRGFANGVRHRDALRNPVVSRTYRRNFHTYAAPRWSVKALNESRPAGQPEQYFAARASYYPSTAETLSF